MPTQTRQLSRRTLLKWMGAGSLALTLAACAPVSPQASQGGETTAAGSELSVLVCCYTPPDLEVRNKVNADFEAAQPSIKLAQELLPAGQNYFEKLQTLIAAGSPPDVFDMWEGYVQPYAANGAIMNLDPFLETDPKLKKDGLLPAAIDGGSWQDHLYALLIGFIPGPVSLYYNAAHFDAAGIDAPTADWKWDDVRSAAQTLTKDTNSDGTPHQWGVAFD